MLERKKRTEGLIASSPQVNDETQQVEGEDDDEESNSDGGNCCQQLDKAVAATEGTTKDVH